MKKLLSISAFIFLMVNVAFAQDTTENKFNELQSLIDSKTFQFESTWLTSQQGDRIDIMLNTNFIKVNNDIVEAYLPYYGVVHAPHFGENGIRFKGAPKKFKVIYDDKKQRAKITFSAASKNEHLTFYITVFKNNRASIHVNSNTRSSITYDGKIMELEKNL